MSFGSLFSQCVIVCPLPKKQPTAVMWIAVTVMSKTKRESTRLKIICRTVKKIQAYSPYQAKLMQGNKRPTICCK